MPVTIKEIKNQEVGWRKAFDEIEIQRGTDTRTFKSAKNAGAYLTPDMIRQRQKLTKGGTKNLVLDYGHNKDKVNLSLKDLNEMAKRINTAQGRFKAEKKGIPAADILKHSTPNDRQRAKDVKSALLYKFSGDILYFRATASGDTPEAPTHYRVRIQLHDWTNAINSNEGAKYLAAAKQATSGRLSFDCNCGRYTYWYHYLASIGGFDVEPHENVFPKIRNPKLTGCACKHVLKALLVLNAAQVQSRIALEMQNEAKKHGIQSREDSYLKVKDMKALRKASLSEASGKAFGQFSRNVKAFLVKQREPNVKAKQKDLAERNKKTLEKKDAKIKALETATRKLAIARLRDLAATSKGHNVPFEKLAANSAKNNPGMGTAEELIAMAKEEGLI